MRSLFCRCSQLDTMNLRGIETSRIILFEMKLRFVEKLHRTTKNPWGQTADCPLHQIVKSKITKFLCSMTWDAGDGRRDFLLRKQNESRSHNAPPLVGLVPFRCWIPLSMTWSIQTRVRDR